MCVTEPRGLQFCVVVRRVLTFSFYFPHFSLVAGGVTFPYWVSFLETHSLPFQVGLRRLPFQASLATPVLVLPSCSELYLFVVLLYSVLCSDSEVVYDMFI